MKSVKILQVFFVICFLFSKGEARAEVIPDVYDDFSDGKYQNRTGTDPWGRTLPTWNVEQGAIDASAGYIVPTSFSWYNTVFNTQTDISKGTWKFRYKYVNGVPSPSGYCLGVTAKLLNSSAGYLRLDNPVDGHWWVDFISSTGQRFTHSGYISNMAGSQINPSLVGGSDWHEVVFIRDENNFVYTWLDGIFIRWSTDVSDEIEASTKFAIDFFGCSQSQVDDPIAIDDVMIYKDKYLPPLNAVAYDAVAGNIKITGWGATLQDIATAVNDPAVFSYDASSHTATTYKDILVNRGSKLKIEDGTLLMSSATDGERKIKYYTDAAFEVLNSTIDSTNANSFSFQRLTDPDIDQSQSGGGDSTLKNTFRVINSTINNAGGIFLERPVAVDIENSHLTNLVGTHPIQIYFRWPAREMTIKNSVFTGKTGTEIVYLSGGDQFGELSPKPVGMDIIDCDFSGIVLQERSDDTYYLSPLHPGGTLNLINTKTNVLNYESTTLRNKYYLDVKVVDKDGNPVSGANVTVTNEIDNSNHPAENLASGKDNFQIGNQKAPDGSAYFGGQSTNWIRGWDDVNNYSSAVTGQDGYTPLPSDALHTLVIADAESKDNSSTPFTYSITAEKNGLTATTTGVNPASSWYRDASGAHQNTITLTLNEPLAATPVFSPSAGTFTSAQNVAISSATSGATIYYTNNGADPTASSTLYSSAITISSTSTIKAIAVKANYTDSNIASATYTINIPSGGGEGVASLIPTILKTEIKSLVGNLLALDLSVNNASQMMLSDTSSFLGSTWINYTNNPTYTKQLTQTKLYIKFKSSTDTISSTIELTIPTAITNPSTGGDTPNPHPTGTLLKLSDSFKVYVIIGSNKKWIPTPEVFEQLGYKWTEIKVLTPTELNSIPDYEDNLIRAINDYKVYLVVNGVKRHIPNPIIFLDYGFKWEEVKDVPQSTIDKYKSTYLIKQSGSNGIYYVNPQEIRKLIPNTEVFNSYSDKTEDIQIISKTEMDFYPLSNLIKQNGSNDIYLIEGNTKKRIPNIQVFNKYKLNWNLVMSVNQTEFNFYSDGGELR